MSSIVLLFIVTMSILILGKVAGKNLTCGNTTFIDSKGSISSPGYPGRYSGSTWCSYEIHRPGEWLRIIWASTFDIDGRMPDCYDDGVDVFVGCGSSSRKVSRFCSRNAGRPHPIFARDGCARLVFSSRYGSPGGKGFKVNYEAKSLAVSFSNQSCLSDYNTYEESGLIVSPGWPVGYQSSYLPSSGECDWHITLSHSKRVLVNIMDMDLRTDGRVCNWYSDKLKVNEKKCSMTHPMRIYTYCSLENPLSLSSYCSKLSFEFGTSVFSPKGARRGFVVGFVAYTEGDDGVTTYSKTGPIVGGVFAAVAFVCAVVLLARWYKRWHPQRGYEKVRYGTSVPPPPSVVHLPPPPQVAYPQQTGYYPQAMAYPQPPYPQDQYKGNERSSADMHPASSPPGFLALTPHPSPDAGNAAGAGYGPQPGYSSGGPLPYPPRQGGPAQ